MESNTKSNNVIYTRDQMLKIREAVAACGDSSGYPIVNSVISRDPEKRPHFRKYKSTKDGITIPNRTPGRSDHFAGSYESNGDGPVLNSAAWRRTRRTSGTSVPQSPLDAHNTDQNNSCSSNGEESVNNSLTEGGGQVRREFDWTLGCGKWRHRSTSGSERGAHKGGFFMSAGRGRGRGGNDGNGGSFTGPSRGRGFMRRPFQHGAAGPSRGGGRGGLKHAPFTNHGPDHGPKEEDFEPQDEQILQQYQHLPPPPHHQFHRHDAGGPVDGDLQHQGKQKEVPSSLDNHSPQSQSSSWNKPPAEVQERVPQFTSPLHHGPDISTNSLTDADATTNTPGSASSYPFMSSNHPPLPPHLQFPPGQTGSGETQAPPPPPSMWHYRDPHGNIHGPFNDGTMRTWYEAGYFTSDIQMRRECDKVFSPLSEYESKLGGNPFMNSRGLLPIESSLTTSTIPQPPSSMSKQQPSTIKPIGSMLPSPISGGTGGNLPVSIDMLRSPILTQQQQQQQAMHSQQTVPSTLQDPKPASKTVFDLTSMSQMTLMDMLRLREIALMATNSVSQAEIKEKTIAEALAALKIRLPVNPTSQPPAQPDNVIDLQQLEAAIHRRQQEEEEAQNLTAAEGKGARQLKHEAALSSQVEKEQGVEATVSQPQNKRKEKVKKVAPAQGEQRKREEEEVKQATAAVDEQEQQPVAATTTNAPKKKKKKSKNAAAAAAAEVKPVEAEKVEVTEVAGFLEPEDDWVAVPGSGATFNPQTVPKDVTLWQQQNDTERDQTAKKSKKKKKGKLSAAELQQQAWEQEEERRRKANTERIAREEAALAAALAEEEDAAVGNLVTSGSAKSIAAARRQLEEAQRIRQQQLAREAAKKEAEASLANFKLPSTARWGGVNKNVTGTSSTSDGPTSMADILAAQMQEEELERLKPNAGHATFASKVASGIHTQPPPAGKPKPFVAAAAQPSTQAATKQAQHQSTKQPAKLPQKAPVPAPKTPAASKPKQSAVAAAAVPSIWNMAADTKSANTKKGKKKKANANSNLLTGSIISLTPNARQELVRWCENKLSAFQRGNVDIPTLISLLCDMEEDQDVLECIESSFGKSQRVSNFSKAFVEKRATLMGATA